MLQCITGWFCASWRAPPRVSRLCRAPAASGRLRWRRERRTNPAESAGRGTPACIWAAGTSPGSASACRRIRTPRSRTPPAGQTGPARGSGWASRSACCCVPPERACGGSGGSRWSRSEPVCEGRSVLDGVWRAGRGRLRSDSWLETRRPSSGSAAAYTR